MSQSVESRRRKQSFVWARQFPGNLSSGETVFEQCGWARSVGGATPYISAFARAGLQPEVLHKEASAVRILELPSARGCTHYLPHSHFNVGIVCARGFADTAELRSAEKHLGVTMESLEFFAEKVLRVLESGATSTTQLRNALSAHIRTFGEEGKKRGITSDLPLALTILQSRALIHRIPSNGRLDTQSFHYKLWNPPLSDLPSPEEADIFLANLYWQWLGIATASEFRWFSGFTAKRAKLAMEPLELVEIGDDNLASPQAVRSFREFVEPSGDDVRLLSALDSAFNLTRRAVDWFESIDLSRLERAGLTEIAGNGLSNLPFNAILNRNRVIGFWEYDSENGRIVHALLTPVTDSISDALYQTETMIRDELGDFRSFSLDSQKARKETLARLTRLALALNA